MEKAILIDYNGKISSSRRNILKCAHPRQQPLSFFLMQTAVFYLLFQKLFSAMLQGAQNKLMLSLICINITLKSLQAHSFRVIWTNTDSISSANSPCGSSNGTC